MLNEVKEYLENHKDHFVEELKDFLRIASVSADSAYKESMQQGAEFVLNQMKQAGLTAEIIPTKGHPIVYGEWTQAEGQPTVLVYGHYDVQPPDPLEDWETPPFEPTVRGDHIYARGATDDKGQLFTHLKAVEAWMKTTGSLPVNIKFIIEGEEEVGSDNLDIFLEENKKKLKSDIAVISDTSQYAPGIPAITYGLRGIFAVEVHLKGPSQDLHSGVFGGSVTNPANTLAKLIASLHDDNGRVQIPGFYDDVTPLTDEEKQNFSKLPFNQKEFFAEIGLKDGTGEEGFTTTERRWARPTCDVNGLLSGYTGEGPKTIIPSLAMAKITCRLVPNQNADKLVQSLKEFLTEQSPPGIELEFIDFHGCGGIICDTESDYMTAARSAIEQSFGTAPVMIREGGSIPVVSTFREILKIDTLLLGWGQNTDNLHSPNERFSLSDFHRGTLASALLLDEMKQ
jgi:acetylornithine deacetylase/succinyl-diaminopimelate desuccinylase-like protein